MEDPKRSAVTVTVLHNLEDQHDWKFLQLHSVSGVDRPLIRGLPPRLLYLHPDDQVAALTRERAGGVKEQYDPKREWVLAVHVAESWSFAKFAAVFDAIPQTEVRGKRFVLATLHNDSTVVYYLLHEGMVKPRQN